LFVTLDRDNDDRLGSREMIASPAQLAALDRNSDGEVSVDEMPDAMALGVARGDPQQAETLFAIPVTQIMATPDSPRWFQRMDVNLDGVISQTEFPGEPQQFNDIDSDGDGYMEVEELKSVAKKLH